METTDVELAQQALIQDLQRKIRRKPKKRRGLRKIPGKWRKIKNEKMVLQKIIATVAMFRITS